MATKFRGEVSEWTEAVHTEYIRAAVKVVERMIGMDTTRSAMERELVASAARFLETAFRTGGKAEPDAVVS